MLPRPGGWLSRCCAYQGSFPKSSKSVVNSVAHIRESACFSRLCRDNQGCCVKKRKDGRYQKKVTLSDGRQKLVYGHTIAEVNQAADQLRDQDRQGLVVGDTTTVDEWAKTWFATYKSDLRANTQAMYRNAYNVHILPYLATQKDRKSVV